MTKVQECLAQNMKYYRKLRHITQESLAEKINSSTNYIGIIEIGGSFPSPQMLEKIADALEISSPKLFEERSEIEEKDTAVQQKIDVDSLKKKLMKNLERAVEKSLEKL